MPAVSHLVEPGGAHQRLQERRPRRVPASSGGRCPALRVVRVRDHRPLSPPQRGDLSVHPWERPDAFRQRRARRARRGLHRHTTWRRTQTVVRRARAADTPVLLRARLLACGHGAARRLRALRGEAESPRKCPELSRASQHSRLAPTGLSITAVGRPRRAVPPRRPRRSYTPFAVQ